MKFLKKLFLLIMILIVALCAFIAVCALDPQLSARLGNKLYADAEGGTKEEEQNQTADVSGTDEGEAETSASDGWTGPVSPIRDTPRPDSSESGERGTKTDNGGITVPEKVAGKSGYRPVEGSSEQIGDAAGKELEDRLSFGETGDGLSFAERLYPYYHMLNADEQSIYRQIYANANALTDAFRPIEEISADQLRDVFAAVYNDHPELFWLETSYACKCIGSGRCVEIDLRFNRTVDNLKAEKETFAQKAEEILEQAKKKSDDYEKEKEVHDCLTAGVYYDAGAEMNQSAYSALVNKATVCAGYSRAMQYLLQQLDIPCYYCTGYAGENHAWNIVELSDGYYNVDVTWDDTPGGEYDYFNCSDADYAATHARREMAVNLPACQGEAYRGLERSGAQSGSEASPRSLREAGFYEEDVCKSLQQYYDNCYMQVVKKGTGEYEFFNVVDGEALWQEIQDAYKAKRHRQGYMEEVMTALGATRCDIELSAEKLEGGRYLLKHKTAMKAE